MKSLMEMTTHEMAEAEPHVGFWPVGTIEAHDLGPLGTDVIAPQKLAEDLSPRFGALLLPTLPFGLVSSLAGHAGGLWVSEETYVSFVSELLGAMSRSSLETVVIFNGHGGNTGALGRVLSHAWKDHGLKAALIDWWTVGADLSEDHFGAAGGHGGADELALVRAAKPELAPETWDGSRAFTCHAGVKVYPAPRSALRYSSGSAKPLTAGSASAFYVALVARIDRVIREILKGWSTFNG